MKYDHHCIRWLSDFIIHTSYLRSGPPGRFRACDLLFFRQTLLPLSYEWMEPPPGVAPGPLLYQSSALTG